MFALLIRALAMVLFVVVPMQLAMADEEVDALKDALTTASGSERVAVLNKLAKSQWGRSADDVRAYAGEAAALAETLGDAGGRAEALRNIAIGHWYEEDLDAALDYAVRAADAFEQTDDRAGQAAVLSLIGTIHLNLEQLERARSHYLEALGIAEAIDDQARIGIVLSNLGTVELGLENPAGALDYLGRALTLLEASDDQRSVLNVMANIGGANRRLGRHAEAIAINRQLIELATALDLKVRVANALADIGISLTELGRHDEARAEFDRAIAYARANGQQRPLRDALKHRSTLEERDGRFAAALRYHQDYTALHLKLSSEEQAAAIAKLQVAFDTERKQREIALQRLQIERIEQTRWALLGFSLLLLALLIVLWRLYRVSRRASARFEQLSRTDPLTGLANRRAAVEAISAASVVQRRGGAPASAILLDVDHFKQVNDRHGHDVGDQVLKAVADALQRSVREQDLVARWGGEEFLVLVRGPLDAAAALAERILDAIRAIAEPIAVTATAGVAACDPGGDVDACINAADAALYRGKEGGRDRVVLATAAPVG